MDKQKVRERILEIGIIPVVRASSAQAKPALPPKPFVRAEFLVVEITA